MELSNRYFLRGVTLSLLFLSGITEALEYAADVNLELTQSDNAFLAEESGESELASRMGINFSLLESQRNYMYDLKYNVSHYSFGEGSDEERSIFIGSSNLRLGSETGLFSLYASHTSDRTLIDTSLPDLLSNSEERTTVTVEPNLNLNVTSVDTVSVRATYADIRHETNVGLSSTREGVSTQWNHRSSAVSSFGLNYSVSDVEYIELDDYIYTYESGSFYYNSSLRKLDYQLSAGYNRTDLSGSEFSSPSYDISIDYRGANSTLGVTLQSDIADTSQGNSAVGYLEEYDSAQVASSAQNADRYKQRSADVVWQSGIVCARCRLKVSYGYSEETYDEFPENDNNLQYGMVSLSYSLSSASDISYSIRSAQRDYELDADEYKDISGWLEFDKELNNGFSFGAYLQRVKRMSDLNGYSENIFGLTAAYEL